MADKEKIVENALDIKIEGKEKVFSKCKEYWNQKPSDFMIDIDHIEKHIPEEYQSEILSSLKKYKK